MIKTFCDVCGKEIKKGDELASITSIDKQSILSADRGKISMPQATSVTRLVCGECFVPIKKIFENAKK